MDEIRVQPLAEKQRRVLQAIERHFDATGEYPSVRYLARRLALHHETIRQHLGALYRKNWLKSPSPAGLWIRTF